MNTHGAGRPALIADFAGLHLLSRRYSAAARGEGIPLRKKL